MFDHQPPRKKWLPVPLEPREVSLQQSQQYLQDPKLPAEHQDVFYVYRAIIAVIDKMGEIPEIESQENSAGHRYSVKISTSKSNGGASQDFAISSVVRNDDLRDEARQNYSKNRVANAMAEVGSYIEDDEAVYFCLQAGFSSPLARQLIHYILLEHDKMFPKGRALALNTELTKRCEELQEFLIAIYNFIDQKVRSEEEIFALNALLLRDERTAPIAKRVSYSYPQD